MHPFLHPYKLQTTVIHSYSSIHPCLQVTEDSYSSLFKLQTTAIHLYSSFHPSLQVADNSYTFLFIHSSLLTSYKQQLFISVHPFILSHKLQTIVIHPYLTIHPYLQVTDNS